MLIPLATAVEVAVHCDGAGGAGAVGASTAKVLKADGTGHVVTSVATANVCTAPPPGATIVKGYEGKAGKWGGFGGAPS